MINIKRSLTLRVAVPVIVLVLALGLSLYFLVFRTLSDFVRNEIERDLESISHRLYNICNTTYDSILQSGLADDNGTIIIEKALTLGKFEDFFRQEEIEGLIYHGEEKELVFRTTLPTSPENIIAVGNKDGLLVSLSQEAKGYFSFHFDFTPWEWNIIIIKSEKKYGDLISQVKQIHLYTIGLLFSVSILLIFFIYQSVQQPINAIIQPLKKGLQPEYKGIEAFEYLSDTIRDLLNSIKQSEEKYRSLVETTSDFVWEVDKRGCFSYASPTIKGILGYEPQELLGKNPFDLMPPDVAQGVAESFRKIFIERKPFERMESVHLHKDGHPVVLEASGIPIISAKGELLGYRGIDRDVTERIRLEEERKKMEGQLQQLQKLEAIGTLAGGIAHDYNNLLSVIMGNITLAKEDAAGNKEVELYLENAEVALSRAQDLTSLLITFSKGGAPVMEVGSIAHFLRDTAEHTLSESKLTCIYDLPPDLWLVEFDGRQMKHAIKNIIINAAESMPQGGTIWIGAQNYTSNSQRRRADIFLPQGKYVKIYIKDSGSGIQPEHLTMIFDPYFSTKRRGTQKGMGLGLTISYSVVNRHSGYISVESEVGKGSVFSIYIPAYEYYQSTARPAEALPESLAKRPKKILLMDDEEMLRKVVENILKRSGYESALAKDGAEAVDMYKRAFEAGRPFDVVILDLSVKGGMGGKEAVRLLKEINPNARVIVSSGYSNDPVMTDYRAYGFCMALSKPYNVTQLNEAIKLAVNAGPPESHAGALRSS